MSTTPTVYALCNNNCRYETMTKEQILTAIAQTMENGEISDLDTGFITTIKTITGTPLKFFVGTQVVYDSLPVEEQRNLFAIITDDISKDSILKSIEDLGEALNSLENSLREYEREHEKDHDKYALVATATVTNGTAAINEIELENNGVYLAKISAGAGVFVYDAEATVIRVGLGGILVAEIDNFLKEIRIYKAEKYGTEEQELVGTGNFDIYKMGVI